MCEQREAFPGGHFMGLLWGYALDNQRRAVFEVRPDKHMPGWRLLRVNRSLQPRIQYQRPDEYNQMWALPRGHFYDSWALEPQFATRELLTEGQVLSALRPSADSVRYPYGRSQPSVPRLIDVSSTQAAASDASRRSSNSREPSRRGPDRKFGSPKHCP